MLFRRFVRDRKANVAPLLALAMIPIIGAVTAAIDYNRANIARTSMQAALDATSLMIAKESKTVYGSDITSLASNYFKANFNNAQATNVTVTSNLQNPQPGSYVLDITASATVPVKFTSIFGKSDIDISASSEAVWGIHKLNLALALDNTGSMAQSGKMDALKTAAHNLLSTLQNAAHSPGDIKVSIIPFDTDVNVGTANVNATWIDWSDWDAANGTCSGYSGHTRPTTPSSCTSKSGTWVAAHSAWNGCVYDRDQNNDVGNSASVPGTPATMFRAHQAASCPASMMPLSEDWAALNAKIDTMTPTGNTNVTIGMALAWQTLTAADPFDAPAKASDLDKVIVLLTDGTNTQNRWSSSETSIDSRTSKACTNAKADNIKVYTVRVIDGNATLLKGCATKTSMYYDVQQANQLNAAFGAIAQNLANLRLTK